MKRTIWMAMAMMAAGMMAAAQTTATAAQAAPAAQAAAAQHEVKRVIVVSLEDRKLALVEDGEVKKVFPVAVGKPSTPSPVGTFSIQRRVVNPVYHHGNITVQPGPNNPVGDRWMALSIRGYGIHGTNAPRSIGKAASHGCIRMAKPDVEELFRMVKVGDTVELIGQRNEETARLFGPEPVPPTSPAQSTVLAQAPASAASAAPRVEPAVTTAAANDLKPVIMAARGTR